MTTATDSRDERNAAAASDPATRRRPLRVAETIKRWVVEQGLQPGDRLPGEAELIERFDMSKGTIREAMRVLEAQGLVRTRTGPGGGAFVHAVSEIHARSLLGNYFYFKELSIADIYQLRRSLEPELAASLAGRLDEDQLAGLEAQMAKYAEPARDSDEERRQHVESLRFHVLLAALAGNELLGFVTGFMASMLADLTVYRRLYEPANRELWQEGLEHHRALIKALREGKPKRARELMRAHMDMAERHMKLQEAEMERRFLTGHQGE